MAGPSWLAWTFAGVMIIVSAYCLTRLAASWRQRRPTDHRVDGIHVLMGVAMAGMLVPRLRVFWIGGWEVVFAVGVAWFGWLAIREFRGRPTTGGRPEHHLQHVLTCGAMLYMYLAVATVAKAAAGGSAMGGMAAGGAHFRTLALVLATALLGYVVWTADRLSSLAPVAALTARSAPVPVLAGAVAGGGTSLAAAGGEDNHGTPRDDSPAPAGQGRRAPLSPRLAACCEIAMGVTMGYMLILML
jgi:cytochrome b561